MSILTINNLALQLVADDFTDGHPPTNGGPTRTSRALAIIHLAAHDAYAEVQKANNVALDLKTQLSRITPPVGGLNADTALLSAGFRAAELLYPDSLALIRDKEAVIPRDSSSNYGRQVAEEWLDSRLMDRSNLPQTDNLYSDQPGRHRADPLDPNQLTLGRNWGRVTFFVSANDQTISLTPNFLEKPPELNSPEYATAFNQVIKEGKFDTAFSSNATIRDQAVKGIFWGYDGANRLGTPPRLYNQVVRKIKDFDTLSEVEKIKILTAINVAMADAGIAAWHWKYEYDVWRPIVGIREADQGWGPTGLGDGNPTSVAGDPFWLPLGAPKSNPFPAPIFGSIGTNGSPGFPAYPSGHATFGAACFETAAQLLGKKTEDVMVEDFVSDEFNGITTDDTGAARPKLTKSFSLKDAIQENNLSRIYLGVHWIFDATGGEFLGKAIADRVAVVF